MSRVLAFVVGAGRLLFVEEQQIDYKLAPLDLTESRDIVNENFYLIPWEPIKSKSKSAEQRITSSRP